MTSQRAEGKPNFAKEMLPAALMLVSCLSIAACPLFLRAQASAPTEQSKFEAISIKPNNSGNHYPVLNLARPGGHVTGTNCTLRYLIAVAYDLGLVTRQTQQTLLGTPDWVDSELFDIEAEAPGNPSVVEKRLMLLSLLADRFKLAVHHESRQLPVFDLVLAGGGKKGPQLQPHMDEKACYDASGPPPPRSGNEPSMPCGDFMVGANPSMVLLAGGGVTMQMLAKQLSYSQGIDRAVLDWTGLSGDFDVRLGWAVQLGQVVAPESGAAELPNIFTAVQEQLGLKLEPTTGPVDVLVIDHVEEPSAN